MININEIATVHIAVMFTKPVTFDKVDTQFWLKKEFNLSDSFTVIPLPDDMPQDMAASIPVISYSDKRQTVNVSGLRYDTVYTITDLDVSACETLIEEKLLKHAKVVCECFPSSFFRVGIVVTAMVSEPQSEMFEKLVSSKIVKNSNELMIAWSKIEEVELTKYNSWIRLNQATNTNTKQLIVDYNTQEPIICAGIDQIHSPMKAIKNLAFQFIKEGKVNGYAE